MASADLKNIASLARKGAAELKSHYPGFSSDGGTASAMALVQILRDESTFSYALTKEVEQEIRRKKLNYIWLQGFSAGHEFSPDIISSALIQPATRKGFSVASARRIISLVEGKEIAHKLYVPVIGLKPEKAVKFRNLGKILAWADVPPCRQKLAFSEKKARDR